MTTDIRNYLTLLESAYQVEEDHNNAEDHVKQTADLVMHVYTGGPINKDDLRGWIEGHKSSLHLGPEDDDTFVAKVVDELSNRIKSK